MHRVCLGKLDKSEMSFADEVEGEKTQLKGFPLMATLRCSSTTGSTVVRTQRVPQMLTRVGCITAK